MAFAFHGIGTIVYGERDYWPDGSFITTEWFVVAWIPIAPIISKRISYTKNSDFSTYDQSGYYVYEIVPLVRAQVMSTYAWFATMGATFAVLFVREDQFLRSEESAALILGWIGVMVALPFVLRWRAKRRKRAEWHRQNMGLPPTEI